MRIAHLAHSFPLKSVVTAADLSGMSRQKVLWAFVGLVLAIIATAFGIWLAS
jgi:hypothetical protein